MESADVATIMLLVWRGERVGKGSVCQERNHGSIIGHQQRGTGRIREYNGGDRSSDKMQCGGFGGLFRAADPAFFLQSSGVLTLRPKSKLCPQNTCAHLHPRQHPLRSFALLLVSTLLLLLSSSPLSLYRNPVSSTKRVLHRTITEIRKPR